MNSPLYKEVKRSSVAIDSLLLCFTTRLFFRSVPDPVDLLLSGLPDPDSNA
jgi:hypothetical protein